jgi:predicted SAM-dependent methyltransferase
VTAAHPQPIDPTPVLSGFRDVTGRLAAASAERPVALDLGCGPTKRLPGAIGIDILEYPGVDVVGNVYDVLDALPPASVSQVHSSHFFEHIDDPAGLVKSLARVVRPGGTVVTVVPYFSHPPFYSDPTHRATYGLYSFSYLAKDTRYRRDVPNYFGEHAFEVTGVELTFHAPKPNYVRFGVSKAVQKLVNRRPQAQEKYELKWCWIFPAKEIIYTMVRRSDV